MTQVNEHIEFDTSDVDRHIGKPVGGGQLKEPVTVTDIRRWVQAMQYPNPLHFDDDVAAASVFGRIVAPQSFTICCDVGHGAGPAIVGNIPGTHMIFGGDEWWFAGPRIYPGDLLRMKRRFVDYKVSETKFAGPTMFSRGETLYTNQRGERVAKQWSTAVRYRADVARDRGFFEQAAPLPTWTEERLAAIETQRTDVDPQPGRRREPHPRRSSKWARASSRAPSAPTRCPAWPRSGAATPSPCGARPTTRVPTT